MKTDEDIEGYLIELGKPFEKFEAGLWMIDDTEDDIPAIRVWHCNPWIEFRIELFVVPTSRREELFETLLKLNASTDLLAGAYGLDERGMVVITDTLQSENLDYNEFVASVEGVELEIKDRYPDLKGFRDAPTPVASSQEAPSAAAAE